MTPQLSRGRPSWWHGRQRWAKQIAHHASRHDRDGTFVDEAYELLRASGYLALAVPTELGGRGATIRETTMAQRELARYCAATALASAMHHHVVLFTAWRHRRDMPGAEATLRRVVDDAIVIVSTGGADFTSPRGSAIAVDGGYLVSGRKAFASQVPAGDVFSTMFALDDGDNGRRGPQCGRARTRRGSADHRDVGHPRHARNR